MVEPVSIATSAIGVGGALALAIVKQNPGCLNKLVCGKKHKLRGVVLPVGKTTLINNLNIQSSKFHFVDLESESKVFIQNTVGPLMLELKQKGDYNAIKNIALQTIPDYVSKIKVLKNKKLVLVASSFDLLDACGCSHIWCLSPSQNMVKELDSKLNEQDKSQLHDRLNDLYRGCNQNKVLVYNSFEELNNLFKALFATQLKF